MDSSGGMINQNWKLESEILGVFLETESVLDTEKVDMNSNQTNDSS